MPTPLTPLIAAFTASVVHFARLLWRKRYGADMPSDLTIALATVLGFALLVTDHYTGLFSSWVMDAAAIAAVVPGLIGVAGELVKKAAPPDTPSRAE